MGLQGWLFGGEDATRRWGIILAFQCQVLPSAQGCGTRFGVVSVLPPWYSLGYEQTILRLDVLIFRRNFLLLAPLVALSSSRPAYSCAA